MDSIDAWPKMDLNASLVSPEIGEVNTTLIPDTIWISSRKFTVSSKSYRNENFIMQSGYEEQTYEINFFELCCKNMELMKQIHLFKKGFVIFLKGAPFSDFIETGL